MADNDYKTVFGLAKTEEHARRIWDALTAAGFGTANISILYSEDGTLKHKDSTKAAEGTAIGAGTGGALGAVVGWLAGAGALAIPGLGPFVAAGPIMAALSGAAVGAAAGSLGGALIGLGIPEYEAVQYQDALDKGGYLMAATVQEDAVDRVEKIFKDNGAESVSTAATDMESAYQR